MSGKKNLITVKQGLLIETWRQTMNIFSLSNDKVRINLKKYIKLSVHVTVCSRNFEYVCAYTSGLISYMV